MVIPHSPTVTLSDSEFRYAARHRLGLPPQQNLPTVCVCDKPMHDDPAHFHSCSRLMPRAITTRHDSLVQLLAVFRRAGAVVDIELKCGIEARLRPDLEIVCADRPDCVNVRMIQDNPLAMQVTGSFCFFAHF